MSMTDRIARALRVPAGEGSKPTTAPTPAEVAARFSWHPSEEDVLLAELLQARQAADVEAVNRITTQLNALAR